MTLIYAETPYTVICDTWREYNRLNARIVGQANLVLVQGRVVKKSYGETQ